MKGEARDEDIHYSCLPAASRLIPTAGWQTQSVELNREEELPASGESSELFNNCMCALCHRRQKECTSRAYNRTHRLCPSNSFSESRTTNISSLLKQMRQLTLLTLLSLSLLNQIKLTVAAPLVDEPVLPERCRLPFSDYDCGGFQETRYTYRNGSCHMAIEWMGPDCEYDGTENSFSTKEECEEVCISEEPSAGNANPPLLFPPLNDAQPSTSTATSQTAGTAGGDPLSSTDPSTVDTSVCLHPISDITCTSFSFPTTYYYYDSDKRVCQSRISFCPINLPGYFEMREECVDTCERPLNPPATTTPPPSTTTITTTTQETGTEGEPDLTSTSESDTETTDMNSETPSLTTVEQVSMTTQQKTSNKVTTTTSTPATPITTTDNRSEKTTERTLALSTTDGDGASPPSQGGISFRLNKFDMASLALGLIAVVLILVLVIVISLSMYSRQARLRRQKQEVMDSKKTEVRTLAFTTTRQEKSVQVKHSSMSSTSSTISSYLTTV